MKTHTKHLIASLGMLGIAISAIGATRPENPAPPLITLEPAAHPAVPREGDFADGVAKALPSIVTIRTSASGQAVAHPQSPFDRERFDPRRDEGEGGTGSGVIVSADGHIVTNHHVIRGAGTLHVELNDGRRLNARLLGSDPDSDLALLKVDAEGLVPADFASSETLRLGESVAAIGNPFDVGISISTGVVSALGRHGTSITEDDYFIQTDAALNPGNSGGALIDRSGRVVGINTAIHSRTGSNTGVGFAVPSTTVQAVCQQLLEHGNVRRGQLGVVLDHQPGTTPGVAIQEVASGGAAATAGLRAGDRIVAVNGKPVPHAAALRNAVRLAREGDALTLRILRDETEMNIQATLTGESQAETMPDKVTPRGEKKAPPSLDKENHSPDELHRRIMPAS